MSFAALLALAALVGGFAVFVLPELKDMMDSMGGDDFPPGAAV